MNHLTRRDFLALLGGSTAALAMGEKVKTATGLDIAGNLHTTIRRQLDDASRLINLDGEKLHLDYLFDQLYDLRRTREFFAKGSGHTIDAMMPDGLANDCVHSLIEKIAQRFGGMYLTNAVKIPKDTVLPCVVVDVIDAGCSFAVFTATYGDPGSIWLLDWSDVGFGEGISDPPRHLIFEHVGGFTR